MFIHSIKIKKLSFLVICSCIFLILFSVFFYYPKTIYTLSDNLIWNNSINSEKEEKKYIKWVDFGVTYEALDKTSKLDINSHVKDEEVKYNWIEILSYLSCKYGGNFKKFNAKDLSDLESKLKSGFTMSDLTNDLKNYNYYYEAYSAVLNEFIGEYEIEQLD